MRKRLLTSVGLGAVLAAMVLPTVATRRADGAESQAARIIDHAGKPVERAHVWFLRGHDTDIAGDDKYGPIVQVKGLTDARGALPARVRTGGSPNEPRITSSCFLAFHGDTAAFRCRGAGDGDVALESARRIRVRLRLGDKTLPAEALVRLHFPGGDCSHGIDLRRGDGDVFQSPPLPSSCAEFDRLRLSLSAPDLWSGPYDVPPPASDGASTIDVVPTRTVTGRAIDVSGEPVPNATVWSHNPAASYLMEGVTTGDDGAFALSDVLVGETGIYVRTRGLATARMQAPAGTGTTDVGDIVLLKGRRITGRVVEEDDVDVVSFAVFVEDAHGARIATAEAKGAGRFETDLVADGPVTLSVFLHWSAGVAGARGATREVLADEDDVQVVVPTGLRIRLVDSAGDVMRVSGADVRFSFDGDSAGERRYDGSRYGAFSEIRLWALSPETEGGKLSVAVKTDEGHAGEGTVTVGPGGRADVQVRLDAGK